MASPILQSHEPPPDTTATAAAPAEDERAELTARLLQDSCACDDPLEQRRLEDEVAVLNMGVARAIALRYRDRGVSNDDLVQVAYVGLVKSVRGFDAAYERDFLSYAVPTITGEVKRHFRDHGWTVRPPRRIQELQSQVSRAGSELTQELHRSPTPREVADFLGVEVDDVIEALAADGCFTPSSLDVPIGEDGTASLAEMLGDHDPDMTKAEARIMLAPAVRQLAERDRKIIALRFFRGWTQEQIAKEIGVTQMQVSRLLARILADLRGQLA